MNEDVVENKKTKKDVDVVFLAEVLLEVTIQAVAPEVVLAVILVTTQVVVLVDVLVAVELLENSNYSFL